MMPHSFPPSSSDPGIPYARSLTALWLGGLLVLPSMAGMAHAEEEGSDFANHVLPLMRANCIACHNTQKAEGGLNLESFDLLMKGGDSGPALVSGKGSESELVRRIQAPDDSVMPPDNNAVGAKRFTPEEIALIQAWVDAGAPAGVAKPTTTMQWKVLPETVRPMYAIDATLDGQFVVAGRGNHATVYRWPALDGGADSFALVDPAVQSELQTQTPVAHLDLIQSIALSPDGARVATGGFRDVKIWRRQQGPQADGLAIMLRGSQLLAGNAQGTLIARATPSPAIEIHRTDRAKTSHRLAVPSPIVGMAWSVDSTRLLATTDDASVHQFVIENHESDATVAVSPAVTLKLEQPLRELVMVDSQSFLGITPDKRIHGWTMIPGAEGAAPTLAKMAYFADVTDAIACCRYEEAGAPRVAIALGDGRILVVSVSDGAVLRTLQHGAPIAHMTASGDHTKLASVGADGSVKAWNTADGSMLWEQRSDYDSLRRMEQAELLAARQKSKVDRAVAKVPELEKAKQAEMDAQGKLQASRTQISEELTKKQTELEAQDKSVTEGEAAMAAAMQALEEAKMKAEQAQKEVETRKTQRMAAQKAKEEVDAKLATMDKTIAGANQAIERAAAALAQFQATLEAEKQRLAEVEQGAAQTKSSMQTVPATRALFSADHRSVITAHTDGTVHLMRADQGIPQGVFGGGFATYVGMAATAAGTILGATEDGRAMGWIAGNRWVLERTIGTVTESPFSDRVTAMDWSDHGDMLVVGSGAPSRFGELKMIRVADGSIVKDWGQVHSDSILAARLSPDGLSIATGAADKLVRLHRVDSDTPPKTLEGHTHHVLGLAWHDDGHWLASSSADNSVKVWDIDAGTAIRTIPGFGKEVTALSFVGRTHQLLSTSADQQTRLHDASNGSLVRAMGGPSDAVYCAAVAGRTPVVIAGGQDGVMWIWQLDNGQALHQIK